ncbi:hydroxymethylglutaryl-CoA synthase [Actinotignum sanguinis]|uniref:Hydroxymethylglutaryl-CoA synthase n=2 Tax=Actinomycetaceae TaxID=2049 RepID=A0ABZ0RD28_9ACTO|nr:MULTISPECIES: hydroxymethylglutaryl-CoA synthase [Actinotignum]WPJ89288.1 hydroxymethylglutaryl-CoA synthase [Schaalia turicensis]MDE1552826.1 hydroxymethylglutaryl-CoA synthase [Actinotignum sanguinis]MDE1565601.1 hydroxymethylglutaryl-CoA synthase [Actinotignum sanguinis]MDE1577371.1 hydroxymethylglutaryl-CoA synthase [Actinotignum sanguinis]MDE1642927.1 hydroxymethylglutaryl-CoA synthase [Actinotignum sanguinis]
MNIGIDALACATSHYCLPLADMAEALDVPVGKYHVGLGQEHMSIPALDEDAVTLGAQAGARLLAATGTAGIRTVIFATESGVDQSKSAGVFLHALLELPRHVRTVEMKEACYGGTAALQSALGIVARHPKEKVLVIAADIARYAAGGSGEPTQGAGAVAFLVSAEPRLLRIPAVSGVYTADINDFWRPNDSSTPLVDGHLSMDAYMDALTGAYDDYLEQGGIPAAQLARFVHHQPFGKMARKAHARLMAHTGDSRGDEVIESGLAYGRQIGNSYTAALYIGILSLLGTDPADLTDTAIGLFSYGSGAVAEFFTGIPVAGYRERLRETGADAEGVAALLAARETIDFPTYRVLHGSLRTDAADFSTPPQTTAPFRFAGVSSGVRQYEVRSGSRA